MNQIDKSRMSEDRLLEIIFELEEIDDRADLDQAPPTLKNKLYNISRTKRSQFISLRLLSTAASVLIAGASLFIAYQYNETQEIELARQELMIAFQYLDQTQREIEPRMTNVLRENLQRSAIRPVIENAVSAQP